MNFDGGFPYYSWWKTTPQFDGAFPMGLGQGAPNNFTAETLINDVVVWSSSTQVDQTRVSIDVRNYRGKHRVKFRLRAT